MFRLIEPSSDQNHKNCTLIDCVHYGITYCL